MKKKRLLTLMALAVMTVGAWAQEPTPTMTLTLKDGSTTFVNAEPMTSDSENHWSLSKSISRYNKRLTIQVTYNSSVNSGYSNFSIPGDTPTDVKFYARYVPDQGQGKVIVTCDALDHAFCDANWKVLGIIPASLGNSSSSTILNIYQSGSKDYQQLVFLNPTSDNYYLNPADKTNLDGGAVKYNGTLKITGKPSLNLTPGVYKATLNYAECCVELEALESYPLTIGSAGAATLVLPYQVTLPSELSAYTLTSDGSTTLTASKIAGGVIPAMTPVLINGPQRAEPYILTFEGAAGTYPIYQYDKKGVLTDFIKDVEPGDDAYEYTYEDNVLHGVLAPHYVLTDGYNFVLQNNGGNVGFYQVSESTYRINPFRAFINLSTLPVDPSSARALTIVYDDENTTGVKNVKSTMAEGSNEIYNLSGQRVGKDYKGVVIKNGRKMIQK